MSEPNIHLTTIKAEDLKYRAGMQGWEQFLQGKKDILSKYDSARIKSKGHETPTHHGNVGEAAVRDWLSSFLPARYAVTSGFIIPQIPEDGTKFPHFDIIIYDHLESPVLWLDENPDTSKQGKSKAIPVEHVLAVLEVKSRWTPKSAQDAIKHLHDLDQVMAGIDKEDELYKKYLPKKFFCGIVFFELMQQKASSAAALDNLNDPNLRGYIGAVVLRGENIDPTLTGKVEFLRSTSIRKSDITRGSKQLLKPNFSAISASVQLSSESTQLVHLSWLGINFAKWASDILTMLKGTRSNFYGLTWRTHQNPKARMAPAQHE